MCNSCKIYVTDGFYYNYVRHVGSATKKLNVEVDSLIVDTIYSINERVYKYKREIISSRCFVYSICLLINSFAFNKYVKKVSLSESVSLIECVYADSLVRNYIKKG